MNKTFKLFSIFLLLIISFALLGCDKNNDDNKDNEDTPKVENVVTHDTYKIMEGTTLETVVHVFTSSIEGPTIFITGGTHGDELAGWHAADRLITEEYYKNYIGKVIIIPHLNSLACSIEQRYPGVKTSGLYDGTKYEDLNRSFPGKEDGTLTEKLAYTICEEVRKYNPKYVVDLHESRGSYDPNATGSYKLGNQLLYANGKSSLMCEDILEVFNRDYLSAGDTRFNQEGPGVAGSFNEFYGQTLKCYGFTIETSRQLSLEKRISQQINIIEILFDYAWNK